MGSREELLREYLRRQGNLPSTQLSDALLAEDQIHVHNKQLMVVPQNQEESDQEEMEEFKYLSLIHI